MKSYEKDGQKILVSAGVDLDSDEMFESVEQKKEKQSKEQDFSKSNCLIKIKFQDKEEICGTLEQYSCSKEFNNLKNPVIVRTIVFWAGYDDFSFLMKIISCGYSSTWPEVLNCSFEFLKGVDIPIITRNHKLKRIEVLESNGPLFKISLLITSSD